MNLLKIITFLYLILLSSELFSFNEYHFIKRVNPKISFRKIQEIKESVDRYHQQVEHWISKEYLYKIMALESRFKTHAKSKDGQDNGLFQIRKSTYRLLIKSGYILNNDWKYINNIDYNVYVAVTLLRVKRIEVMRNFKRVAKYKRMLLTLITYNKGLTQTKKDFVDFKNLNQYNYIRRLNKFF